MWVSSDRGSVTDLLGVDPPTSRSRDCTGSLRRCCRACRGTESGSRRPTMGCRGFVWRRALEGEDAARQAWTASGPQLHGRLPRQQARTRTTSADAGAVRAQRLPRDCCRDAGAAGGGLRSPRSSARRDAADDRRGAAGRLCAEGDSGSPSADVVRTQSGTCLRSRDHHGRRFLRLRPWSDRRRAERNRAPPDSRLPLPYELAFASARVRGLYPTVCVPPPPPDLDCGDIPFRDFTVLWTVPNPDPHHFDGDRDGVGCAT